MAIHPRAGTHTLPKDLINIPSLVSDYFLIEPNAKNSAHKVLFGTSGHRGSSSKSTFNQTHILAITQAVVDERKMAGLTGPMFVGKDTHALSEPAFRSVIDVLIANDIKVIVQDNNGFTPTPGISHAILTYNLKHTDKADGIVITPSHNPPQDGGIKYNPSHGGPAEGEITQRIEDLANQYIVRQLEGVKRSSQALEKIVEIDFVQPYVDDLINVIDMDVIQKSNIKIGIDPLGGAGIEYWRRIASTYNLDITLVNEIVDPSFQFMTLDKDGVIRMDCSSPYAMASLLALKDDYDLAFGNDPDYDRHGIVTPQGLMDPNHYLAVCIDYLFRHRNEWGNEVQVGKTLVSSAIIDRVVADLGRELCEVPVGFKWFVDGLYEGRFGFGGEESAGASFLRKDGTPWSTDKDGIALCLLAAEIMAVTGKTPSEYYRTLTERFGEPFYKRVDTACSPEEKAAFKNLSAESVSEVDLAGDPITAVLVNAPGNGAAIGGLKVTTENGWFAARPSGTESLYKVYAESFKGPQHLDELIESAKALLADALKE